jgi:hypothetical protein
LWKGKPATPVDCWFNMTISNGAWKTPDGFKPHCIDNP